MRSPSLIQSLIPVLFLIGALGFNVIFIYGDDSLNGSNQFILLLAAFVAAIVGISGKLSNWGTIFKGIGKSISSTSTSIIILLLIGSLAGSWMLSGIIPAMIYYGTQLLRPDFFLLAGSVLCAMVSLATGSSWSTSATIGIALVGIGQAFGMNEAWVAGAVISGAYFGDKLSPLSDTTNLAPAMAGTDIFTHIRYMSLTTVPSFVISCLIFLFMGLSLEAGQASTGMETLIAEIEGRFYTGFWLLLPPAVVLIMIAKKIPAIPAILTGTLLGSLFAVIFQYPVIAELADREAGGIPFPAVYRVVMDNLTVETTVPAEDPLLKKLLVSGGMAGMLPTVWLILAAMVFGGTMEACGFLQTISAAMMKWAKNTASLVATTAGTCISVNITASDQYLAIVIPGRMYADLYKKRGLAPENLSRTLEDSGTVTSVLVPWNTCGAYQAGVLQVGTLQYLPFCFFNLISPVMTVLYAALDIRIRRLITDPKDEPPQDSAPQ